MNEIAKLLTPAADGTAPFPPNSRHHGAPVRTARLADGREVAVVGRRFTPRRESVEVTAVHVVRDGDRPDLMAAAHFGDPSQAWRIWDANGILDPRETVAEPGRRLAIGLPVAIPGRRDG